MLQTLFHFQNKKNRTRGPLGSLQIGNIELQKMVSFYKQQIYFLYGGREGEVGRRDGVKNE